MWDNCCDYDTVREIRVKTTAYIGVGAIDKIDGILGNLKNEGVTSVLCVCGGHAYRASGAWDKAEAAALRQGVLPGWICRCHQSLRARSSAPLAMLVACRSLTSVEVAACEMH